MEKENKVQEEELKQVNGGSSDNVGDYPFCPKCGRKITYWVTYNTCGGKEKQFWKCNCGYKIEKKD